MTSARYASGHFFSPTPHGMMQNHNQHSALGNIGHHVTK